MAASSAQASWCGSLDAHLLEKVLRLLAPRELARLACVSRTLAARILSGPLAVELWHGFCSAQLNPGQLMLQQSAAAVAPNAAAFWQGLYRQTQQLDSLFWCGEASRCLISSVESDQVQGEGPGSLPWPFPLRAPSGCSHLSADEDVTMLAGSPLHGVLARTGHSAAQAGRFLVVQGGILRTALPCAHTLLIDLATLTILRPEVKGAAPSPRFRHTSFCVVPQAGSRLYGAVFEGLAECRESLASFQAGRGFLVLLTGGYNIQGTEFGGSILEACWVEEDGSAVTWAPLTVAGRAPSCRHHHSGNLSAGKYIVWGGEGEDVKASDCDLDDPEAPPAAYVLDVQGLQWQRVCTHPDAHGQHPGLRALHCTTVREGPTGPELVVLGGYKDGMLASMAPWTLDLTTFTWRAWPGLPRLTGLKAQAGRAGKPLRLPTPRQRAATLRITRDWLLLSAGCPERGDFLDDVQRLHLPTLTWRGPPPGLEGAPAQSVSRVVGHTLEAGVAFGGCVATVTGIVPIAKIDVLMLGKPMERLPQQLDMAKEEASTERQLPIQEDAEEEDTQEPQARPAQRSLLRAVASRLAALAPRRSPSNSASSLSGSLLASLVQGSSWGSSQSGSVSAPSVRPPADEGCSEMGHEDDDAATSLSGLSLEDEHQARLDTAALGARCSPWGKYSSAAAQPARQEPAAATTFPEPPPAEAYYWNEQPTFVLSPSMLALCQASGYTTMGETDGRQLTTDHIMAAAGAPVPAEHAAPAAAAPAPSTHPSSSLSGRPPRKQRRGLIMPGSVAEESSGEPAGQVEHPGTYWQRTSDGRLMAQPQQWGISDRLAAVSAATTALHTPAPPLSSFARRRAAGDSAPHPCIVQ